MPRRGGGVEGRGSLTFFLLFLFFSLFVFSFLLLLPLLLPTLVFFLLLPAVLVQHPAQPPQRAGPAQLELDRGGGRALPVRPAREGEKGGLGTNFGEGAGREKLFSL